ncbi:ATP-binding cassette domain-containing protein [Rhizobium lusitanum]|uniref:ATP-binding cassette domain-containing protein n=1 Tax=Rhizobium lusitanum TaxID=293958 RepID=A0A6L9UH65_9HYPH|nr:ABC transporter ATP-binding protein [Rhizobium lusitanum]NEI73487.1 ATP-binding cassette domain-containing protein [Rhizobium lusitanum]
MQLSATDISVRFAGVSAIDKVSMALDRGEILGLIGPNGAGKTTMVNVLSGFQKPREGRVAIESVDCAGRSAAWFSRHGVVRTFQAVRLFKDLTISENIEASLSSLGISRFRARRRAAEMLDYMGIGDKADRRGGTLSYGDERRVGIARALALAPKFLLLDEPAAGLNIGEAESLADLIRRIQGDFSCGVLLIEHNMTLVMTICRRLHVMASGRTIATGTPAEVLADPQFKSAYLGTGAA